MIDRQDSTPTSLEISVGGGHKQWQTGLRDVVEVDFPGCAAEKEWMLAPGRREVQGWRFRGIGMSLRGCHGLCAVPKMLKRTRDD